ncbi:hypothetical protein Q3198_19930, partial [Clostridioides difficile]
TIIKNELYYRKNEINKIVWTKVGFNLYLSKRVALTLADAGIEQYLATVIVRVITMHLESNITSGKIFKFKKYVIIKEVLV